MFLYKPNRAILTSLGLTLAASVLPVTVGCGGKDPVAKTQKVEVQNEHRKLPVHAGDTVRLKATVKGAAAQDVVWTLEDGSAGTITSDGLYAAAGVPGKARARSRVKGFPEATDVTEINIIAKPEIKSAKVVDAVEAGRPVQVLIAEFSGGAGALEPGNQRVEFGTPIRVQLEANRQYHLVVTSPIGRQVKAPVEFMGTGPVPAAFVPGDGKRPTDPSDPSFPPAPAPGRPLDGGIPRRAHAEPAPAPFGRDLPWFPRPSRSLDDDASVHSSSGDESDDSDDEDDSDGGFGPGDGKRATGRPRIAPRSQGEEWLLGRLKGPGRPKVAPRPGGEQWLLDRSTEDQPGLPREGKRPTGQLVPSAPAVPGGPSLQSLGGPATRQAAARPTVALRTPGEQWLLDDSDDSDDARERADAPVPNWQPAGRLSERELQALAALRDEAQAEDACPVQSTEPKRGSLPAPQVSGTVSDSDVAYPVPANTRWTPAQLQALAALRDEAKAADARPAQPGPAPRVEPASLAPNPPQASVAAPAQPSRRASSPAAGRPAAAPRTAGEQWLLEDSDDDSSSNLPQDPAGLRPGLHVDVDDHGTPASSSRHGVSGLSQDALRRLQQLDEAGGRAGSPVPNWQPAGRLSERELQALAALVAEAKAADARPAQPGPAPRIEPASLAPNPPQASVAAPALPSRRASIPAAGRPAAAPLAPGLQWLLEKDSDDDSIPGPAQGAAAQGQDGKAVGLQLPADANGPDAPAAPSSAASPLVPANPAPPAPAAPAGPSSVPAMVPSESPVLIEPRAGGWNYAWQALWQTIAPGKETATRTAMPVEAPTQPVAGSPAGVPAGPSEPSAPVSDPSSDHGLQPQVGVNEAKRPAASASQDSASPSAPAQSSASSAPAPESKAESKAESASVKLLCGTQDPTKGGDATFQNPMGVAADAKGFYVADNKTHTLRLVRADNNQVTTFAGTGVAGDADGKLLEAAFRKPSAVSMDPAGRLFVMDEDDRSRRRVRLVIPGSKVLTVLSAGQELSVATSEGKDSRTRAMEVANLRCIAAGRSQQEPVFFACMRKSKKASALLQVTIRGGKHQVEEVASATTVPQALVVDRDNALITLTLHKDNLTIRKYQRQPGQAPVWAVVEKSHKFVDPGKYPMQENECPIGAMTVDSAGCIYFSHTPSHTLWKADPTMNLVEEVVGSLVTHGFLPIGANAELGHPIFRPLGLAMTDDGLVFTTGNALARVTEPGTERLPWVAPSADDKAGPGQTPSRFRMAVDGVRSGFKSLRNRFTRTSAAASEAAEGSQDQALQNLMSDDQAAGAGAAASGPALPAEPASAPVPPQAPAAESAAAPVVESKRSSRKVRGSRRRRPAQPGALVGEFMLPQSQQQRDFARSPEGQKPAPEKPAIVGSPEAFRLALQHHQKASSPAPAGQAEREHQASPSVASSLSLGGVDDGRSGAAPAEAPGDSKAEPGRADAPAPQAPGSVRLLYGIQDPYQGGESRSLRPVGVAADAKGIYVVDNVSHSLKLVHADGTVTHMAGRTEAQKPVAGDADGRLPEAAFRRPSAVSMDPEGRLFILDEDRNARNRVRLVTPGGEVETVLSIGQQIAIATGESKAGEPQMTEVPSVRCITAGRGQKDPVFFACMMNRRKVGGLLQFTVRDGRVDVEKVADVLKKSNGPQALAVDRDNCLYALTMRNQELAIQKFQRAPGNASAWQPTESRLTFWADGNQPAGAQTPAIGAMTVDSIGCVYFTDTANHTIWKVDPSLTLLEKVVGQVGTAEKLLHGRELSFGLDRGIYQPLGVAMTPGGLVFTTGNAVAMATAPGTERMPWVAPSAADQAEPADQAGSDQAEPVQSEPVQAEPDQAAPGQTQSRFWRAMDTVRTRAKSGAKTLRSMFSRTSATSPVENQASSAPAAASLPADGSRAQALENLMGDDQAMGAGAAASSPILPAEPASDPAESKAGSIPAPASQVEPEDQAGPASAPSQGDAPVVPPDAALVQPAAALDVIPAESSAAASAPSSAAADQALPGMPPPPDRGDSKAEAAPAPAGEALESKAESKAVSAAVKLLCGTQDPTKGGDAAFLGPMGVAADAKGVYVADNRNHTLRLVRTDNNQVTTFAGTGVEGDADGKLLAAAFRKPSAVSMDPAGRLFVMDEDDRSRKRVRLVIPGSKVLTVLSAGQELSVATSEGKDGQPREMEVDNLRCITAGRSQKDPVFFTCMKANRRSSALLQVTVRGGGIAVEEVGSPAMAPQALAVDRDNALITLALYKDKLTIRKYEREAGKAPVWAWNEKSHRFVDPGKYPLRENESPIGAMTVDGAGCVYFSHTPSHTIWKLDPAMNLLEPVVGSLLTHGFLPIGTNAELGHPIFRPLGLAMTADGLVFTTGNALAKATEPGTERNPWVAPSAPGQAGGGFWGFVNKVKGAIKAKTGL